MLIERLFQDSNTLNISNFRNVSPGYLFRFLLSGDTITPSSINVVAPTEPFSSDWHENRTATACFLKLIENAYPIEITPEIRSALQVRHKFGVPLDSYFTGTTLALLDFAKQPWLLEKNSPIRPSLERPIQNLAYPHPEAIQNTIPDRFFFAAGEETRNILTKQIHETVHNGIQVSSPIPITIELATSLTQSIKFSVPAPKDPSLQKAVIEGLQKAIVETLSSRITQTDLKKNIASRIVRILLQSELLIRDYLSQISDCRFFPIPKDFKLVVQLNANRNHPLKLKICIVGTANAVFYQNIRNPKNKQSHINISQNTEIHFLEQKAQPFPFRTYLELCLKEPKKPFQVERLTTQFYQDDGTRQFHEETVRVPEAPPISPFEKGYPITPYLFVEKLPPAPTIANRINGQILQNYGMMLSVVAWVLYQENFPSPLSQDAIAERTLQNFLQVLDPHHLFFLASDVEAFESKYAAHLKFDIADGNVEPIFAILDRLKERVYSALTFGNRIFAEAQNIPPDFLNNETIERDRSDAKWPATEADAHQLVRLWIKAEWLTEHLKKNEAWKTTGKVKWKQKIYFYANLNDDQAMVLFLRSLASAHSPWCYFDTPEPVLIPNLRRYGWWGGAPNIDKIGSTGIIACQDEKGLRITKLIPDGPAANSRQIHVGDYILNIREVEEQSSLVERIHPSELASTLSGDIGSSIIVTVESNNENANLGTHEVTLERALCFQHQEQANAKSLHLKRANGEASQVGWIHLPSFYDTQESSSNAAEDMKKLIKRLKKEGIQSLVLDIRNNPGGKVAQLRKIFQLFCGSCITGIYREYDNSVTISNTSNILSSTSPLWTGPLVVLTNRDTASCGDHIAAYLQDYKRAIIIGDSQTYGKGCAKHLVGLSKNKPVYQFDSSQINAKTHWGTLDIVMRQMYRLSGDSVERVGVKPDVIISSLTDSPKVNAVAQTSPLPNHMVPGVDVEPLSNLDQLLPTIKMRSLERRTKSAKFKILEEDVARERALEKQNQLSLNLNTRLKEQAEETEREQARNSAYKELDLHCQITAYELLLTDVSKANLENCPFPSVIVEQAGDKTEVASFDPIAEEAVLIAADLAEQGFQFINSRTRRRHSINDLLTRKLL